MRISANKGANARHIRHTGIHSCIRTLPLNLPELITLHGRNTSLVLEKPEFGVPLWRYWGPRLPDAIETIAPLAASRPLQTFSLDHDQPLSLCPTLGGGWFHQSAILAHASGQAWSQALTLEHLDLAIQDTIQATFVDSVSGVKVIVHIRLDPVSDVITAHTELINNGAATIDVQWLAAATLPLPDDCATVHFWGGRHPNEFVPQAQPLARSIWRRENRRGLTSHDCVPTAFVETARGGVYGAHLAWSGNSAQQIEWIDDGQYAWQMGEWLAPGEVRLAPGQSLTTPDMIATFSPEGRNGAMQNFHTEMRSRLNWPGGKAKPRPVQINTWEGFYFNHDLDQMKVLATEAADIGIERFILDDGWFHGRNDDTSSLGDWWPDAHKYPDGLSPLATHVTSLGMEFGLWVEPEMVNPESELAREHPEWIMRDHKRPDLTARNQMVLDLTQQDAADYIFDKLSTLLGTLPISYLKWDHNRDLTTSGQTAKYRKQINAAYALFGRIRKAFPNVEIEACAGGGGRIDAGILPYVHRFWTSDNIDARSRTQIQSGFLSVFPPEIMGAHVGASPSHSTSRSQSMDFRSAVALPGHFGVELNLLTLDQREKARLAYWIDLHKALRSELHTGKVWSGALEDGVLWQMHGDASSAILFIYRLEPTTQRHALPLRLDMLTPDALYQIDRLDHKKETPDAQSFDEMRTGDVRMQGAWLTHHGLPLPALKAERAMVLRINRL